MRSAWSPARSMSLETFFDVLANWLLTSPTVLAIDLASTLGRCLGIGTPSTVLRRVRPLSAIPPAMPAAAAPTAIAGPFALPAADFTVSTTPWPLLACPFEDADVVLEDPDVAFARPFEDVDAVLERPFADVERVLFGFEPPDAGFFRLAVVRDAVVLLRVLAVFGRLFAVPFDRFAVPADRLAVLLERFVVLLELFVPEVLRLVSATGSYPRVECHAGTTRNHGDIAIPPCTPRVPRAVRVAEPEQPNRPREMAMPDTPTRDAKLVDLLNQAYAKERQLEVSLQAHAEVTTDDDYAKRLKDHLKETKSHATQLSKRIKQLGGTPATVSVPGPDGVGRFAQNVAGKIEGAKAAAQGTLQSVRRDGEQERMLHNARLEYADEAEEIATYTVIDSLATTVGDKETAKLARDIRREEERMQKFLADLLPELSAKVAHDEIPISEIEGKVPTRA